MQETFKCSKCKKQFHDTDVVFESMPDNMNVATPGVKLEKGIPKCPFCGYLHFFGFESGDIAY